MPHISVSEGSAKSSIDIKANGEVSRMRSHKGNMPSLPQTKYCALCPAKFTRTTHLNRHLRSHTNERAHRCNTCSAEFTRSDLLTRHKRTCGDSNVNRSRRKSCQACAESKVKCNLQHPCSKCSARGRECVFINDPEASRIRKIASKKLSRSSASPSEADFSESSNGFDSLGPSSPSSSLSYGSHGCDSFPHLVSSSHLTTQLHPSSAFGILGVSSPSDTSSVCSSRSSPRLDFFESRQDLSNAFNMSFDMLELDSELNDFFPTAVDPFVPDPFPPCLPRVQTEMDLTSWFDSNQATTSSYGSSDPLLYSQQSQPIYDQDFSGLATLSPASSSKPSVSRHQFSTICPVNTSTTGFGASSASGNPTTEELDLYMYLFFTEFNMQIPLFHRPTWKMDNTHPLLIRAMQACGALFAKTQSGMTFVIKTLACSRDALIAEFSKSTCTLKDHMCLMLAVVLLQSIGLLQPRPEQRGLSKMYHDILVMMIRKTGLIKLTGSWPTPDLSNFNIMETIWRDWARYETFKRALILTYLQDCSFSVYYSAVPSFHPSEFEINLPCDDALWKAQTARDWYHIQRTPSPYATGIARILGVSMQQALHALEESSTTLIPYAINPFASFVLVHTILRDIFSTPISQTLQSTTPGCHGGIPSPNPIGHQSGSNSIAIQCALHNWQRMWTSSPEAVQSEKLTPGMVPFVCNAIPLYWLARFAEGAKQNGTLHFNIPLASRSEVEERYRTVKAWMVQIHNSLQAGVQQLSTSNAQFWQNQHQNADHSLTTVGMATFSHHTQ